MTWLRLVGVRPGLQVLSNRMVPGPQHQSRPMAIRRRFVLRANTTEAPPACHHRHQRHHALISGTGSILQLRIIGPNNSLASSQACQRGEVGENQAPAGQRACWADQPPPPASPSARKTSPPCAHASFRLSASGARLGRGR